LPDSPEHGNARLLLPENVTRYAESSLSYLGPVILFAGLVLGFTSSLWGSPKLVGVSISVALTLIFIGGFLHFYSLLVAYYISYRLRGLDPPARVIFYASFITGLYFVIVGILLSARLYRRTLELAVQNTIYDTPCGRLYNPLLHVLTLGLALALFQRCVFLSLARILVSEAVDGEPPEEFGSHGYEGEESGGGLNTPVHDGPPG